MGSFANMLMNVLLGWMRGLADGVWKLIESPGAGGALAWFGKTWWLIALVLIGGGIVIDWLVWMIRWQPYHIWATKLRRMRAFFTRAPLETVEATGVAGQGTARYSSPRSVEAYRRQEPQWEEEEETYQEPFEETYEEPYQEPYQAPYQEPYQAPHQESYQEPYQAQYSQAYEPEPAYAGEEAYEAHDEAYEAYDEAYDEEEPEFDGDPHAAYRRPADFEPQSIPDAQLGNYPGRRYDPDLLPRFPRQTTAPDPLAAYDAYDPAEVAEYERVQDGLPPIDDPRKTGQESVWTDQPRRTRRRSAREEFVPEPELMPEPEPAPAAARRRRNRAPQPEYAPEPIEAKEPGWNADWYEDWDEEPADGEAADPVPEPPREAQPPKLSLVERVRQLGEPSAEPKKRGKLAQMLDPQMEPIKGLPPRVDSQQAFRAPTLPQQLPPRRPEYDAGQWDDDT